MNAATRTRLAATLGGPSWLWLTEAVRAAWEKDLARSSVRVDLDQLPPNAVAAMGDFLGWPVHRRGTVAVQLARVDRLLRDSGLGVGLADCLTAAGGPLRDVAGARRKAKDARRDANDRLWEVAARHPAVSRDERLAGWLEREKATGKLPADPGERAAVLTATLDVLALLPHAGIGLSQLASDALGRAHALDKGPVIAATLRAIACLAGTGDVPADSAGRRELWATVGVARDTVSSTVLLLNVRLTGEDPLAVTLRVNAKAGMPLRVTLRQLQHHAAQAAARPDGPPPRADEPTTVWVCENPSVLEAAADRLGPASAPLVCVEGRPSVAAARFLALLTDSGARLRYHGDFDWDGIAIACEIICRGAKPWRMGHSDYESALRVHPALAELPEPPRGVTSAWDPRLVDAMGHHRRQVEEEHLLDELLGDLAAAARR